MNCTLRSLRKTGGFGGCYARLEGTREVGCANRRWNATSCVHLGHARDLLTRGRPLSRRVARGLAVPQGEPSDGGVRGTQGLRPDVPDGERRARCW